MKALWHVSLQGRRGKNVCQVSSFNVLADSPARAVIVAKQHSLLQEPINAIARPAARQDFNAFPVKESRS